MAVGHHDSDPIARTAGVIDILKHAGVQSAHFPTVIRVKVIVFFGWIEGCEIIWEVDIIFDLELRVRVTSVAAHRNHEETVLRRIAPISLVKGIVRIGQVLYIITRNPKIHIQSHAGSASNRSVPDRGKAGKILQGRRGIPGGFAFSVSWVRRCIDFAVI